MKNFELEGFGLVEIDNEEIAKIEGGFFGFGPWGMGSSLGIRFGSFSGQLYIYANS